jgi:hypothetical protein
MPAIKERIAAHLPSHHSAFDGTKKFMTGVGRFITDFAFGLLVIYLIYAYIGNRASIHLMLDNEPMDLSSPLGSAIIGISGYITSLVGSTAAKFMTDVLAVIGELITAKFNQPSVPASTN